MNDRIVSITFPKCGTCLYAQAFKAGLADCFGEPPTPLVIGTSQDALGRPQFRIESMVAKVKDDRPACALYKRKEDFLTAGRG